MKKYLLLAGVVIVGVTSCSKLLSELISKFLSMQTVDATFTLPIVNDTTGVQSFGPTSTYINVDSFINSYSSGNYTAKSIKSAHIVSCNIIINNPDVNNNFANIQTCEVDLNSDVNKTMIHPAKIENNPDKYAASLDIPVDSTIDMTGYMNAKQFNYTVRAKFRRPITKPLDCTIHIKMNIEVQ